MDELRYQVDLLSAMNQKLENEERMYRLLCAISLREFIRWLYQDNGKLGAVLPGNTDPRCQRFYEAIFQSGRQVCSSIQEASLSGRFKRKFRERHPETYGWQYMGRVRGKRDL